MLPIFCILLIGASAATLSQENLLRNVDSMNIMIVTDTEALQKAYPNPSKDPQRPTDINFNHAYMIAPQRLVVHGQATSDLLLRNIVGYDVKWYGTSESHNYDNSMILYKIEHEEGVLFTPTIYHRECSCVNPKSVDIRETELLKCKAIFMTAKVLKPGNANCSVYFATYVTNLNGQQELFGYFRWNPRLAILG